jgi:CDP-diacylglycerol--glycerol-3-phosphate 3-phosphatidyltransferase
MNGKTTYFTVGRQAAKPNKVFTIANTLSLFRLGLLPFILFFLSSSGTFYARMAVVFMIAAFATDALDGWIARRFHQVSLVGEILDPVIDKAYTISIAVFLILFRDFPLRIACVIVLRDFLILALGYSLFRTRMGFPRSNRLGKLTGCIYGATALAYTVRSPFSIWFAWTSLVFALISGTNYLMYFHRRAEEAKSAESSGQSNE